MVKQPFVAGLSHFQIRCGVHPAPQSSVELLYFDRAQESAREKRLPETAFAVSGTKLPHF
jgi:hypothetical protein